MEKIIDVLLETAATISAGPRNDYLARVDISKANGGYYSKDEPALDFIHKGIVPILDKLPNVLNYCDFGGGDGFLTFRIAQFLREKGFKPNTILVDANPNYLEKARNSGLITIQANLENCNVQGCNLVTMRGVNHYNSLTAQKRIYEEVFNSLETGGFFISSICSGDEEACKLKSDIVNIPSLGRAYEADQIHTTSPKEYIELLAKASFINITVVGYASSQSWHPKDIWDRSNNYLRIKAKLNSDVEEIENREKEYYEKVDYLVSQYVVNHLKTKIPKQKEDMYALIPDTIYPIFMAQKSIVEKVK